MARYPSTVMVSVECPWDDDEQLDEEAFRRAIRHTAGCGFTRIYVFGTAGEGYAVDTARFRRVIEIFGEELFGTDAVPMVGVITLSTANTVERVRMAYEMGFREFQITLPTWHRVRDDEVETYFRDVCGAFPDALFMHYNSHQVLNGRQYAAMAESVPNLVASKTMTADLSTVVSVVRESPHMTHYLGENTVQHGALYGEVALLGSYGALAPKKSFALLEAARAGRYEEAAAISAWFDRLSDEIIGPIFADRRVDGAYDKTILRLGMRSYFPLRMLSPYSTVGEDEFAVAEQTLRERFPDCE